MPIKREVFNSSPLSRMVIADNHVPTQDEIRSWLSSEVPDPLPANGLPRISVIVPSFNQAPYLEDCLRSLIHQRYPGLEIIVMDGGSSDGSVDIIRRYAEWISHWQSEPDGGQAAAINAGLERATGELAGWLNSDDLLLPNALLDLGATAEAEPDAGWFQGDAVEWILNEGQTRAYPWSHDMTPEKLAWAHTGCQPSLYWRRSLDIRLNPDLHYSMDWDLQLRLSRLGKMEPIPTRMSVNRIHEATKTQTGKRAMADEYYKITRKYGRSLSRSLLYRYGVWESSHRIRKRGEATTLLRSWKRISTGLLRRLHGLDAVHTFNWWHIT